jgi:acyl carrier protein
MTDSISSDILDIMAKHTQLDRSKVTPDTRLDSVGVDSLLMVEIIFDLEEKFDISIPDPEIVGEQSSQFKTAVDVINVVKELIEEQRKTS